MWQKKDGAEPNGWRRRDEKRFVYDGVQTAPTAKGGIFPWSAGDFDNTVDVDLLLTQSGEKCISCSEWLNT